MPGLWAARSARFYLGFSVARRVTGNITTAEDVTQVLFSQTCPPSRLYPRFASRWAPPRCLEPFLAVYPATKLMCKRHEARISPPSDPDYEPDWNEIAPFVDAALD